MGKLKPVVDSKISDVNNMTLAQWSEGRQIHIRLLHSGRDWIANLFRFTDEDGNDHSVLFVEDVPPEDL